VSPETVEFRLPDGSAHPHLLLAGVVQAMIDGRSIGELDALLDRTSAQTLQAGSALPVPRSFSEVAVALRQNRVALEDGGVFPVHVIDRTLDVLDQQA
jgi:glutamine synthetase